jgi:hypothetical protein
VRQFEDIGDKVVRRLLPLFENVEDVSAEAVAHEVGLTLATHVSAEFFLEQDLDPAKLGIALRAERPLARGMFSQAEISLYERSWMRQFGTCWASRRTCRDLRFKQLQRLWGALAGLGAI